jgi:hypothetical protein
LVIVLPFLLNFQQTLYNVGKESILMRTQICYLNSTGQMFKKSTFLVTLFVTLSSFKFLKTSSFDTFLRFIRKTVVGERLNRNVNSLVL